VFPIFANLLISTPWNSKEKTLLSLFQTEEGSSLDFKWGISPMFKLESCFQVVARLLFSQVNAFTQARLEVLSLLSGVFSYKRTLEFLIKSPPFEKKRKKTDLG